MLECIKCDLYIEARTQCTLRLGVGVRSLGLHFDFRCYASEVLFGSPLGSVFGIHHFLL